MIGEVIQSVGVSNAPEYLTNWLQDHLILLLKVSAFLFLHNGVLLGNADILQWKKVEKIKVRHCFRIIKNNKLNRSGQKWNTQLFFLAVIVDFVLADILVIFSQPVWTDVFRCFSSFHRPEFGKVWAFSCIVGRPIPANSWHQATHFTLDIPGVLLFFLCTKIHFSCFCILHMTEPTPCVTRGGVSFSCFISASVNTELIGLTKKLQFCLICPKEILLKALLAFQNALRKCLYNLIIVILFLLFYF